MEAEQGKTFRYRREKNPVSQEAKEHLQHFLQVKKSILEALRDEELTIAQLSEKVHLPVPEAMYYLMSLVKFGIVQTGAVDDMEEYFVYKLKKP
jgi:hypothetical protein